MHITKGGGGGLAGGEWVWGGVDGDVVRGVVFNCGEAVSAPAVQDAAWLSYSCRTVTPRG